MVVTILPAPPHNIVGPGIPISISTDVAGPFPNGTAWQVNFTLPAPSETTWFTETHSTTSSAITFTPWSDQDLASIVGFGQPRTGDNIAVEAFLNEPTGVVDSGTAVFPVDVQVGIPNLQLLQRQAAVTGGFTEADRQQLLQVQQAVVPVSSMDQTGLSILTVPGGNSTLSAPLSGPVFGVIVRIDQIPPDLVPISADPDYWRQTLAQVSIYRSNDLWQRFPVHTQSRIFNLPGNEAAAGVAAIPGGAWLLNMHLLLTTFPGVLATVGIMTLP